MFEFLKNFFVGRTAQTRAAGGERATTIAVQPPPLRTPGAAGNPRFAARPLHGETANSVRAVDSSRDKYVHLSLLTVLQGLPAELKDRLKPVVIEDVTIGVPRETILAQLPSGSVKLPFGELRRAAPDVFLSTTHQDQVPVALPLGEIFAQLDPKHLPRRQDQKHLFVPDEIRSPFGEQGEGLIFSVGPAKAEPKPAPRAPAAPAPSAAPAPVRAVKPASAPPRQPSTLAPARVSLASVPTPPPPAATTFAAPPPAIVPAPVAPAPAIDPEPIPATAAMRALTPATTAPKPAEPALIVPLLALAEAWPDALRLELAQMNLRDAHVALPIRTVEEALKRGRVVFLWKSLRAMIQPTIPPAVSAHDAVSLDLPLKVLAPLFLGRQKQAGKAQQRTAVDENIPNLFFGTAPATAPGTEAAPAASHSVAKPVDTNFYPRSAAPTGPSTGNTEWTAQPVPNTNFLSRCITPKEAVEQAVALPGVVGALAALPDGLMIASHLPAELNPETLAAFLPHIFSKVSQCTKELRMGELNNLHFTVGTVPWKIHRVNAIFFAAFGRAGETLPGAQLAGLAADLDRKKQQEVSK